MPSEVATARSVTPAQATSASSSMSPEHELAAVAAGGRVQARPRRSPARSATEQETPSPSVPVGREGDERGVGIVAVALLERRLDGLELLAFHAVEVTPAKRRPRNVRGRPWRSPLPQQSTSTRRASCSSRDVSFKLERARPDDAVRPQRLGQDDAAADARRARRRSTAASSSLAKGARVALHDQRPPRDRDLTLRDYVLVRPRRDCWRLEARAGRARGGDGRGRRRTTATLDAYAARAGAARARRRLPLARRRRSPPLHGLGFGDEHLDRRSRPSPAAS